MSNLTIVTNQTGPASLLTLSGRVDSQTAPELDAALADLTSKGASKIVVDLSKLEYMSSAGLRALVKAAQAAKSAGGALKLAAVPDAIISVMYTVGLNQVVDTYADAAKAAASF